MRLGLILAALVVLAAAGCLEEVAPRPESDAFMRIPIDLEKGGVHGHIFELEEGGEVEFRFEASQAVDLRLLDPKGRELGSWEGEDHLEEQLFEAEISGTYKLEFDHSTTLLNSTGLLRDTSIALLIRTALPEDE